MKHGGKVSVLVIWGLGWGITVNAVTTDAPANPYQTIVDRNVFSLKPPPPPPGPEETKAPPVKITLTGITTIVGKRALMKAPAPPGKPGEPAKPELSFILSEGQRDGDIEVLEIDEKGGNVKVNNAGIVVTLNIDKDGPKLPTTPLPAGVAPGALGIPGAIPPPGGPRTAPAGAAGNAGFTMPTRTLRLPQGGTPTAGTGAVNPSGGYPQPVAQLQLQQQQAQQQPVSLEQQILTMEAYREMNKNNPKFPPLPTTSVTPGEEAAPQTPGQQNVPSLPRPGGFPPIPQ
jgi:hypothetical protein